MRRFLFALVALLSLTLAAAPVKEKKTAAKDKAAKEKALPPVKIKTLEKAAHTAMKANAGVAAQVAAVKKAETDLLAALPREDVTDAQRAGIFYLCAEVEENLNGVENKKAYLKQKYDTAALFSNLLSMYNFLQSCDSADALPNEKGEIRLNYKHRTRAMRHKHARNMLGGGIFFLEKKNYQRAYEFLDHYYMQASSNPNDTMLARVANWAALCGYMSQRPDRTLKYIDLALESGNDDTRPILQEYKARSYMSGGNQEAFMFALNEGLRLYPKYDFFFVHKEDWLFSQRQYDAGIQLADSMLQHVADKPLYWFAKCRMAMAKNDFDATITYADSTIRLDPKFTDAYYNKAIACLNKAVIAQETACQDLNNPQWLEDKKTIQGFYQEAKPCMEMVRKLEPKNTDRWAPALYRIYLNLNLGKEFDEIDKLLHSDQKENKG